ncbi:FadR/GntR family transcriptional regulator [Pontibacter sp. JAM-7]|uniref:FadR/GntR family transcriptional regulator n=1 Tax=Pontibacter sp. JAM-7 TaxID=3366581 RepID=UPI003AF4A502
MAEKEPVQRQKLVFQLEQKILNGELLPGQSLPSQRTLAERCQLSRATVREAIQALELQGLIETHHGGRSRCLNLLDPFLEMPQEPVQGVGFLLQVMEMRAVLEGEAAYYAARRATAEQLQRIDSEFRAMQLRSAGASTLKKAKADLRFHTLIAESSHHLLVISFSQIFYTRYFNAIYSVLDRTLKKFGRYPERIAAQHGRVHQALLNRNAEMARVAATEHILYTRDLLKACE